MEPRGERTVRMERYMMKLLICLMILMTVAVALPFYLLGNPDVGPDQAKLAAPETQVLQ